MTLCPVESQPLLDVRIRKSSQATELYITARPKASADVAATAQGLFAAAAAILQEHDAAILQERVFATPQAMPALASARRAARGDLADGVEPTWLVVPPCEAGAISGLTVHAVAGRGRPEPVVLDGVACGRRLMMGDQTLLVGCNLQSTADGAPADQAAAMLARAEALLAAAGGHLRDVARTWMWLGDILDWYGDFNRVRNGLFEARGLRRPDRGGEMPASTGIGIGPAGGRCCTMDFVALPGGPRPRFLLAGGRQGSASSYGSAFSRAATARTPAGQTTFVSGTAAIDAAGETTCVGDAAGQIADTLACLEAVLADAGCASDDVVQAIVYCKTPHVERVFREQFADFAMPHVLAVADVCRDNLLFEVEATAMARG